MKNEKTWKRAVAVRLALCMMALACATPSGAATASEALELFVSAAGNDAFSGRRPGPNAEWTDGPLATLERARDEIRKLKQAGPLPAGGVAVVVAGGTYQFEKSFQLTAEDSGTAESPIVYRAAPGAEVRLTGGRSLPPDAFQPVPDAGVPERLAPGARGHVLQAELAPRGIPAPNAFPAQFRGAPPVPELFFNDKRMTLARWPNEGWTTVAKIIDSGSRPRNGDQSGRPGVFEYAGDRPGRWNVEPGVWLRGYWCYDWYEETIRVKSIDRQKRQITLAAPHLYGVKQGNPSPRRYYALNLLEELDAPGEYYVDHTAGRLYFWPPGDLAASRVVLSTLTKPVLVLENASHVVVRGLIVEAGQASGIEVRGGNACRIEACTVRNMRELGIRVSGGTAHRVEACDIHDTGTGGLVLEGGNRKTLTPAGHEALNNHVWRFSQHQFTYASAITLSGVGNRAAHNLIHDAPHMAVGIGGNDHLFEYNVVHHVATETDDCGALYKGRNPSCRGNVIRYNLWHHVGSPMGHGNAAVYFDDGDGGDLVFGNVFYRCGEPGRGPFGTVFSHGGHDNRAENNVFIECKRALGSAPWNDQRWKSMIQGELWQTRLLKEVDVTKPPYTTRYPELVGLMDPQPGQPRVNRAVRNLIVRCGEPSGGNWQCSPDDNWITDADPGFADASAGDFRLRPDAEVFTRLPGFQAILLEKTGLYADPLRPTPPERESLLQQ